MAQLSRGVFLRSRARVYEHDRGRLSATNTNVRPKNHMYVCVYIYILHIFVARSANITYECLSVRGLKRENSMNIWQISGEGRVLMTVMARCTWWYVIRIRYVRKKTLELAWKLPSPRRINASRYRFPSPPFCQFAIGGRRG